MKVMAGFFLLLCFGFFPAAAGDKMTVVTADGTSYVGIQDVHVVSGGRIVILYDSGGATVAPEKLPKDFLDSWGISPAQVAQSRQASLLKAEASLDQSIRAGFFREVNGVVYDLRKPQAGWVQLSGLKILQVAGDGALVQESAIEPEPVTMFMHHLPPVYTDNDTITVFAKLTQPFSFMNQYGYEKTIKAYDVGRVCKRSEIPEAILRDGAAAAAVPGANIPGAGELGILSDGTHVRAIGSAFFITHDGYLLTNHHVVKDAQKVEIQYQHRVLPAKVIEVDEGNDLAVIKVEGTFPALAFSGRESADLGDSVFTIGFPNIQTQGVQPKYTDGKISSLAGMQDDPSEYQISVPVQPGNSGGPLCDANGQVLGIVVARLNDLAMLQTSGVVPQNVNYAVKARPALSLIRRIKGLTPIPPGQATRGASPVKSVEDSVAMVMIY